MNASEDVVRERQLTSFLNEGDSVKVMNKEGKLMEYEKRYDKIEFMLYELEQKHKTSMNMINKANEIIQFKSTIMSAFEKFEENVKNYTKEESNSYSVNENNLKNILNQLTKKMKECGEQEFTNKEVTCKSIISLSQSMNKDAIEYMKELRNKEEEDKMKENLKEVEKLKTDGFLSELSDVIKHNASKLVEWSGKRFDSVLYDSERDDKNSQTCRNNIFCHGNIYFIAEDSKGNVFGHYQNRIIAEQSIELKKNDYFSFVLFGKGKRNQSNSIMTKVPN